MFAKYIKIEFMPKRRLAKFHYWRND